MQKISLGLITGLLILSMGTSVFAEEMQGDIHNFGKMVTMHPEMTTEQIAAMYQEHHGTMGASPSANYEMETCNK